MDEKSGKCECCGGDTLKNPQDQFCDPCGQLAAFLDAIPVHTDAEFEERIRAIEAVEETVEMCDFCRRNFCLSDIGLCQYCGDRVCWVCAVPPEDCDDDGPTCPDCQPEGQPEGYTIEVTLG